MPIGCPVDVRKAKLYWRGEPIEMHPVMAPGRHHTDPADIPTEASVYAMQDLKTSQRNTAAHGTHVRFLRRGGIGADSNKERRSRW